MYNCLIIGGSFGLGVDNYTWSLYNSLCQVYPKIKITYVLYTPGRFLDNFQSKLEGASSLLLTLNTLASMLSKFKFAVRRFGRYDLFHLTNPTLALTLRYNTPAVVTVHDLFPFTVRFERERVRIESSIIGEITRRSMQFISCAERIISISKYTKRDLLRFIDVDPLKVRVIYCGVDHDLFKPRDKIEARRRLGLPLDKPIVLHVGSEEPRKNVPTLIKAFSKLLKDVPNALLVRVGRDLAEVQSLIDLFGLNNKVLYFKAKPNEVAYFYNAADLLGFPSYYEGFGLPPLEAMASGCIVVASSRTSIPEVVGDGGILLDPFDIGGFAYWMREVLTNEGLRTELSKKGYERSMNFSWEKCAMETLKVYEEVLGS